MTQDKASIIKICKNNIMTSEQNQIKRYKICKTVYPKKMPK